MIELNLNTIKITIEDELVVGFLISKDEIFLQLLPIPERQNYAELSNLSSGIYKIAHFNNLLEIIKTEEIEVI